MPKYIDFERYASIYDQCKREGTLHWDNFDTFCEVLDALEKAGVTIENRKIGNKEKILTYIKDKYLHFCDWWVR